MKNSAGYAESFAKKLARAETWHAIASRGHATRIACLASSDCGDVHVARAYGATSVVAIDRDPKAVAVASALQCEVIHAELRNELCFGLGREARHALHGLGAFNLDICGQITPQNLGLITWAGWHVAGNCLGASGHLAVTLLKGREQYKTASAPNVSSCRHLSHSHDSTARRHVWRERLDQACAGRIPFATLLDEVRALYPATTPARIRGAIISEALRGAGVHMYLQQVIEYCGSSPMVTYIYEAAHGRQPYATPYCGTWFECAPLLENRKDGRYEKLGEEPVEPYEDGTFPWWAPNGLHEARCDNPSASHICDQVRHTVISEKAAKLHVIKLLRAGADPAVFNLTKQSAAALKARSTINVPPEVAQ